MYSKEFLEEKGYDIFDEKEVDTEELQRIIGEFQEIMAHIEAIEDKCKRYKDIRVTKNSCDDRIEEIEYILQTFEEVESGMDGKEDAWKNFEEECGETDFNFLMKQIPNDLFLDKEGDFDAFLRDDLLLPMITPYVSVLNSIPKYFAEWIETIQIDKVTAHEEFKKFFEEHEVACFNFNYTETVEEIYGQK